MRTAVVMIALAASLTATHDTWVVAAHAQARPSFDCGRARALDEVAICSDPTLARVEVLHAERYAIARRRNRPEADAAAVESLRERADCGNDRLCILDNLSPPSSDDNPAWVGTYRRRLVREVTGDDLRVKSMARLRKAGSFATSNHGIGATLVALGGLDTDHATATGVVTRADDIEYCYRSWNRDAGGRPPRPSRARCSRHDP